MYIETERLKIVPFRADMAQDVHLNSLDEDTRRFVPDEVFETIEEANETVSFLMDCYAHDEGPFVYPILRKDDTFIGYVQAVALEEGAWEVGYHVGSNFTRNGYASEALRAFLPVILPKLRISEIFGICLLENVASIRVLEKCGFQKIFEGTGIYQGNPANICKFRYTLS